MAVQQMKERMAGVGEKWLHAPKLKQRTNVFLANVDDKVLGGCLGVRNSGVLS